MVSVFALQSEVSGFDPRPVQSLFFFLFFFFFIFFSFCVPRKQFLLRFAWIEA